MNASVRGDTRNSDSSDKKKDLTEREFYGMLKYTKKVESIGLDMGDSIQSLALYLIKLELLDKKQSKEEQKI